MNHQLRDFACSIIQQSGRTEPADATLRRELRARGWLTPGERRQISQAVFDYFRWFGWMDPQSPLEKQITKATQLAEQFESDPGTISDAELLERALPTWIRDHVDVTARFCRVLQHRPSLWIRARPGKGREIARRLNDCQPAGAGPLSDALKYTGSTDLFATAEFHAGQFEIQDLSSQWVVLLCDPRQGHSWWDACAGEGGKMLFLSDLMLNRGLIWASDRSERRLRHLKRRAARAGIFNYRAASWDGSRKLPTKTAFDGVLVDAPCTGVGTWQRNPHARWTVTAADVQELAAVQAQLLENASVGVRPGGKLIYSVCTLTSPETTQVAEGFTKRHPEFELLHVPDPLSSAPAAAQHFLWPQDHGGTGMFVALWRRVS